MFSVGLDSLHHRLKIPEIIERIKNPEHIHAGLAGLIHKKSGHVVCVVAITHKVLAPEQHGKRGFLDVFLQSPDAVKGVLAQKPVHGIKGGATPHFHGPEPHTVHFFSYGQHVLGSHPGRQQRLVSIPKRIILNFDRVLRALFQKSIHQNLPSFS